MGTVFRQRGAKSPPLLLASLTLAPALANYLALWVLNDAWLAIILSSVVFYGGAFWLIRSYRLENRIRLPASRRGFSLGLGLLSALAVAAAGSQYFGNLLPVETLRALSDRLYQSQAFSAGIWQFVLFVAVILPLGEELYWRAGLQGLLARRAGYRRHIWLSAALFTCYHLVTIGYLMPGSAGLPLVAIVFGGGLATAWLTERTGNIWAAVLCHGPGFWGGTIYLVWKYLK